MVPISTDARQDRQPRLTSEDWIECALSVLVESGVEAVQVTALSRRLNVTRGSFYWHFESRESLLDALLTEWRARNTEVMVEALAGAGSLDDGILALFSVWVDHRRFDPRLDHAIRDWARRSETLRASVKAEDAARVQAIAAFFKKHGFEPTDVFIRARVIYFTQISYYSLHLEEDEALPERVSYLEAYFRSFTGRDICPEIAARYRASALEGGDA